MQLASCLHFLLVMGMSHSCCCSPLMDITAQRLGFETWIEDQGLLRDLLGLWNQIGTAKAFHLMN